MARLRCPVLLHSKAKAFLSIEVQPPSAVTLQLLLTIKTGKASLNPQVLNSPQQSSTVLNSYRCVQEGAFILYPTLSNIHATPYSLHPPQKNIMNYDSILAQLASVSISHRQVA